MSFEFEFDEFQTESKGFDSYFEDDTENALSKLSHDSTRRVQEKMEGREVTAQGERSDERRIRASEDTGPDQIRVSSLKDLDGFVRVADGVFVRQSNDLVRQSEKDLWALNETDEGELVIERVFEGAGNPVKA